LFLIHNFKYFYGNYFLEDLKFLPKNKTKQNNTTNKQKKKQSNTLYYRHFSPIFDFYIFILFIILFFIFLSKIKDLSLSF